MARTLTKQELAWLDVRGMTEKVNIALRLFEKEGMLLAVQHAPNHPETQKVWRKFYNTLDKYGKVKENGNN